MKTALDADVAIKKQKYIPKVIAKQLSTFFKLEVCLHFVSLVEHF